MDRRYMVKQRLGQISGTFDQLAVYTTGAASWYLVKPLREVSPGTFVESGLAFAYHGSQLKRGWRKKIH